MSSHRSYILQLLKRSSFLVSTGVVVAIVAVVVSLFFPLKYSATASVLLIPRQGFGVDPYTVIKSAERVGENLAQVIETSTFLDLVLAHDARINQRDFPSKEEKRRRYWRRTIAPQVSSGTGILHITAFHSDPQQAVLISEAVVQSLVEGGVEYVGPQISYKIVDTAIASRFPVKPNLIANAIVGFLFGIILAALKVLFVRERNIPHTRKEEHLFG